jgi:glucan phosphoethanolaminetransferase (alkaline phosphatase superfamily)
VVTLFDFFTFFLGLFLVALGEFFMLAGGAENNLALAIFAVLITIIGLGISMVRELTSDNSEAERDLRKIYGFICFICGMAYIIIAIWTGASRIQNNTINLAITLFVVLTVMVGIVYMFLGYSWVGAFDAGRAKNDYDDSEVYQ